MTQRRAGFKLIDMLVAIASIATLIVIVSCPITP